MLSRRFSRVVFSAIIITKSGGVSLALDLAHTRPHRAKVVYDTRGELLWGREHFDEQRSRLRFISKQLRSPFVEFRQRYLKNLAHLPDPRSDRLKPIIKPADAQKVPLCDSSVDLIVTSPPYASNAIDYMRAHKFSLVWMGYTLNDLGHTRSQTIGGGSGPLASNSRRCHRGPFGSLKKWPERDVKKGKVLHRYYSEMARVLREMHRVLKPGKAAIVVVGSSIMRGPGHGNRGMSGRYRARNWIRRSCDRDQELRQE